MLVLEQLKDRQLININTKLGTQTVLRFETEVDFATVGNTQYYKVQSDNLGDKIIITPLKSGVTTNLVVITKDDNEYVFNLIEGEDDKFLSLGKIKPTKSLDYKTIISVLKGNRIAPGSDITNIINLYEVVDNNITKNNNMEITVYKSAIIGNRNQTVYWIKIKNISNKSLFFTSIGMKDRKLNAVATSIEGPKLENGDSGDYFLFAKGDYLSKNITLTFKNEDKEKSIKLDNIKYKDTKLQLIEMD